MKTSKRFRIIIVLFFFSIIAGAESGRNEELRIIVQFHQSASAHFLKKTDMNSINTLRKQPSLISQITRDEIITQMNNRLGNDKISSSYPLKELVLFRYQDIPLTEAKAILRELNNNPFIEYAEPDGKIFGAYVPSDLFYDEQWGSKRIGMEDVWEYSQGSDDVIVAVLDSGIDYTHPDLFRNIVPGYDFCNDDDDPYDDAYDSYHGTHVAGIIAARGNNSIGIAGVAWNVKIMPLKVLDNNVSGYISDAIGAIDYAIANNVFIINASWGFYETYYSSLQSAIARAHNAGIIFVAAAGNGNSDCIGDDNDVVPYYPASFDNENIISVANSNYAAPEDILSISSNFGIKSVDLSAPGVSILSTIGQNRYQTKSGTSMAAPYVSGAAAIIKSVYPKLSHLEVMSAIMNNVDPLTTLEGKVKSGGRLNVLDALTSLSDSLPFDPPAIEEPPHLTPDPITDLFLEYLCGEPGNVVSNALFKVKIRSRNTEPIDLSDVVLRYYYTNDGDHEVNMVIDYCSIETSSLVTSIENDYVEIGFTPAAGTLHDTDTLELHVQLHYTDWADMNQANDYSFDSSYSDEFRKHKRITLTVTGELVWGYGPEGPTPSPTPYSSSPQSTIEATEEPTPASTTDPTAKPTMTTVPGDVNSDGSVDMRDALLIAQLYVSIEVVPFNAAADVNCDNDVDIVDALLIARFIVGKIEGFC